MSKELEQQVITEIVNAVHTLGDKAGFKTIKDIATHCELTPEQTAYLSSFLNKLTNTKRKEIAKSQGKVLTRRLDSDMLLEGLLHALRTRADPKDTMEYIKLKYNQPEGWIGKVKNRPIPKEERTSAVKKLKSAENLELLEHMLEDSRITFREIIEPDTWNKQLGELNKTITLSDRIDKLEAENRELLLFKEQQKILNEEQSKFNLAVISEFEHQKKLILSNLNLSPEQLDIGNEEATYLGDVLCGIPSEQERWKYLLSQGYSKLFISKLTKIPYGTLKRKMKKAQIS